MKRPKQRLPISERRGVQSVDIAISILNVLTKSDGPLPLRAISEAVGMAPSNVHRYVSSFVQAKLLRQDPATTLYDLGPLSLQVGLAALSRLSVDELAAPHMKRLAADHRVMVLLSVLSFHGPTVVRLQQCSPPIVTSVALGSLLPMRSATGRAFLAFLPTEATGHILEAEFPAHPPRSTNKEALQQLHEDAERTRANFFSTVGIDVLPGLYAVASPILNARGEATAVLSITGNKADIARKSDPALKALLETTKQLSIEAGAGAYIERLRK